MRQSYLVILCAAMCLGAFGCGGTGPGNKDPYTGTYVGTYTNPVDAGGVISITIGPNGQVSGREINTSTNVTGTLSGTLTDGGVGTITDINGAGQGALTLTANAVAGGPSLLTGTLTTPTAAGSSATSTINALSTQGASAGVYAGSFSGNYIANNTGTTTGIFSLIVTGGGAATALIDNTVTNTSFVATGTINSAGNLSLTGGGETINGTLSFTGLSILAGPLTTNTGQSITVSLSTP